MFKASPSTPAARNFAIIDDGNWRGIIAPKSKLSSKQLAMLVDNLEDTDPLFLAEMHKEYQQVKLGDSLISSADIEQKLVC